MVAGSPWRGPPTTPRSVTVIAERGWQIFATYRDPIAAGVVADYLRRNDCPAQVTGTTPAEVDSHASVLVPGALLHRARWLWSLADLTEGELQLLISGELPGDDPQ